MWLLNINFKYNAATSRILVNPAVIYILINLYILLFCVNISLILNIFYNAALVDKKVPLFKLYAIHVG